MTVALAIFSGTISSYFCHHQACSTFQPRFLDDVPRYHVEIGEQGSVDPHFQTNINSIAMHYQKIHFCYA